MTQLTIDSSKMDLRLHSHEFISKFIDAFRMNPCLWNTLNPEYRNKRSRMKAYNRLQRFAKAIEPKITVDEIRKKLQSIRASHRKERRKVAESIKSAATPEEVYVPKLWYYKDLEFLNNQTEGDNTFDNITGDNTSDEYNDNISENCIIIDESDVKLEDTDNADNESVKSVISNISLKSVNSLREAWEAPTTSTSNETKIDHSLEQNRRNDDHNEFLSYIARKLDNSRDEYDIFGKNVAAELRKMNSKQQIIAKKLMNDVIFHGQLQHLTVDAQIQINNFYAES